MKIAKALGLRLWATLWFPLNWSAVTAWPGAIAVMLLLVGLGLLLWYGATLRWRALAFVMLAALPVHQMLLLGPELDGSRVLYLPSIGFALLAGFALQSIPRGAALWAGVALLGGNLLALEQNLAVWGRVAREADRACMDAANMIGEGIGQGREAIVTGLPNARDGAYFLRAGFSECVAWHSRSAEGRLTIPASAIYVPDAPPSVRAPEPRAPDPLRLHWDDAQGRIVEGP